MTDNRFNTMARRRTDALASFGPICEQIVDHLPGASMLWTLHHAGNPQTFRWLRRDDGLEIALSLDSWEGRICASPRLPRHPTFGAANLHTWGLLKYDEATRRHEEAPTGKASVSRPVASIAAEIVRRVLIPFDKLYPELQAKVAAETAARAANRVLLETVARSLEPSPGRIAELLKGFDSGAETIRIFSPAVDGLSLEWSYRGRETFELRGSATGPAAIELAAFVASRRQSTQAVRPGSGAIARRTRKPAARALPYKARASAKPSSTSP